MKIKSLFLVSLTALLVACGASPDGSVEESDAEAQDSSFEQAESTKHVEASPELAAEGDTTSAEGRPFSQAWTGSTTSREPAPAGAATNKTNPSAALGACYQANNVWGGTMNDACNASWNAGAAQCYANHFYHVSYGGCWGTCYPWGCYANTTECCN